MGGMTHFQAQRDAFQQQQGESIDEIKIQACTGCGRNFVVTRPWQMHSAVSTEGLLTEEKLSAGWLLWRLRSDTIREILSAALLCLFRSVCSLLKVETSPTLGTPEPLKVDAANLIRRDRTSAFRAADGVEGRPDFFEIDFPLPWHARDRLTLTIA
jgi:hypothetical protein